MPTRITHFLHYNDVVGTEAVTNAFQLSCVHEHDLNEKLPNYQAKNRNWFGILSGIQVYLTSLGGSPSPTKVTVRLAEDAAGDVVIVPDTEAELAVGLTTGTVGNAMFKVDLPLRQALGGPGNGTVYLFVKVDNGTAVFTGSELTWTE